MPRDGSGVYTLPPGLTAVPNATIESADWNNFTADMQTDANAQRPIIAGGTGAGNVAGAQTNLQILPTTGGTLTGNLTVNKDTPTITLNKTAAAQHNLLAGQSAGVLRWNISLGDAVAETGSNAGSNFSLLRYSDAGAFIDQPLYIMRSTGNVGIGMASPTRKLEVAGIIGVTEEVTNTGVVLKNTAAGGRDFQLLSCATGGVVNGGFVLFDNTAPASRLAIDASGNVGIGTISPGAKLEVVGTIATSNDVNAFVTFGRHSSGYPWSFFRFGTGSSGYEFQNSGGAAIFNILAGGNVGIATNNPEAKLHVNGDISGHSMFPSADNAYTLGNGSRRWTQVWAINGTIQTSDENAKEMIEDADLGLAFIQAVRPIMYRERTDMPKDGDGQPWRYGVSAQQVQHVLGDKPFAGLVQDPTTGMYGTSYTSFIAPLIKAVQELTARLEVLEGATPR